MVPLRKQLAKGNNFIPPPDSPEGLELDQAGWLHRWDRGLVHAARSILVAAPQSMHTGSTCMRSCFPARDEKVAEATHCNLLNIKVDHKSGGQKIMAKT